jgi:predicted O-methyltransferase YrrM
MLAYLRSKLEILLRKIAEIRAKRMLQRNVGLWNVMQEYLRETKSKGCGYIDYACLYKTIRSEKPAEVLECGTGISTLVIAYALMENDEETNPPGSRTGRVTSMEEHEEWFEMSRKLLPNKYAKYVDFKLSRTVEDQYSLFRGVRYEEIPHRAYDFVFVDGPNYVSLVDGSATFDFDYIHVLRSAVRPVGCLIDKRLSTVFALQQLLGTDKVKYSAVPGLGYVKPCTKDDLGSLSTSISSKNYQGSMRLFGNSKLSITSRK